MKHKILITIITNLIIAVVFPVYVTFTKFGYICFGEFYSELTTFCGVVSFIFSLIYLSKKD